MRIDAALPHTSLRQIRAIAQAAELLGFDGLWTSETQHDPFLPLALIASATERLHFGTAVAIGFARSPATLAYTAWDLAEASGGRFMLGLGTQVQAHIERRYGMIWPESPVGKLRELLAAIRAFWQAWQSGERLNFRGEHYRLTLMSPFFNPGPIAHPDIPISIAESAARCGRAPQSVSLIVSAFTATDPEQVEQVRSQIAFYASTPSYRPVMALHGWGETADELQGLARRGEWSAMGGRISQEMLETFAVVISPEQMGTALAERYGGLADRLSLYLPYTPGEREGFWHRVIADLRAAA